MAAFAPAPKASSSRRSSWRPLALIRPTNASSKWEARVLVKKKTEKRRIARLIDWVSPGMPRNRPMSWSMSVWFTVILPGTHEPRLAERRSHICEGLHTAGVRGGRVRPSGRRPRTGAPANSSKRRRSARLQRRQHLLGAADLHHSGRLLDVDRLHDAVVDQH